MTDLGTAEAELFEAKLALKESLAREARLLERALSAEESLGDARRNEHDLRGQIEHFARYHNAVEKSLPWRVIQSLRRLVGRRW